jgi:O-antigen/teichoic acid export membrane protein
MLRSLVKDSAVYAVGVIATQLVGFIMIPIYTRVLTPADYGVIETTTRIVDVINLLLALGLAEALLRHYYVAQTEEDRRRLIATTFSFNLMVIVVGCTLTLPLAPQLARLAFGHERYSTYVAVWLAAMLLNNLADLPLTLWRAEGKPWRFTGISVCRLLTQVTANIILVVLLRWGVWGVAMSNFINAAAWSTLLGIAVRRKYGILLDISWLRSVLRYGLPLVPATFSQFILHYSDRFFLARYATESELGLYSLAYRFGMLVSISMRVVVTAWYPWVFSTAKSSQDTTSVRRAAALVLVVLAMIAGTLMLCTEIVLRLMSAPRFWQASQYVSLIAAGCWFFAAHIPWSVGARLANRTEVVAKAHLFTAGASLLGYAWFIPRYGAWGAAVMTLLSFVCLSLTCLIWSERTKPVRQDVHAISFALLLLAASAGGDAILRARGDVSTGIRLIAATAIFAATVAYVNYRLSEQAVEKLCRRLWHRFRSIRERHTEDHESNKR